MSASEHPRHGKRHAAGRKKPFARLFAEFATPADYEKTLKVYNDGWLGSGVYRRGLK